MCGSGSEVVGGCLEFVLVGLISAHKGPEGRFRCLGLRAWVLGFKSSAGFWICLGAGQTFACLEAKSRRSKSTNFNY